MLSLPSGYCNTTFLWRPGRNCYSLAAKLCSTCCIHQALHLQMPIYFGLYKILFMGKNSVLWKTAKDTWNNSFLKNIERFWEDGIMKLLKKWQKVVEEDGEDTAQPSSWWKWKMCLLFLFKNMKELFGQPSTSSHTELTSLTGLLSATLSCRPGLLSTGPLLARFTLTTPASLVSSEPYRAAASPGPAALAHSAPGYPWDSPGPLLLQVFAQMSLPNEAWIRCKKLQPALSSYVLTFPYILSTPTSPFDLRWGPRCV